MSKTHWRKLYNPDYLGAYSLVNSATGKYTDIVATVASVKVENITGADGKKEDCMVMRFAERDTKPMIINATNAKTMEKLLKTPIIEDWSGRKIQIGVESVKAFGDVVDALRIRKFLPRVEGPAKCCDCSKEVEPAETTDGKMLTAVQVAAIARKRFGAVLCADCMKTRDAASRAAQPPVEKEETESAE